MTGSYWHPDAVTLQVGLSPDGPTLSELRAGKLQSALTTHALPIFMPSTHVPEAQSPVANTRSKQLPDGRAPHFRALALHPLMIVEANADARAAAFAPRGITGPAFSPEGSALMPEVSSPRSSHQAYCCPEEWPEMQ